MYIIVQYCKRCGKVFRQRTCNPKGRKYCSDACRYNRNPPAEPQSPVPNP
jgi:hypothetical protein